MTTLKPLPCPCCGYKKITMWPMKDYESPLCEMCGLTVCENIIGTGTKTHLSVWNKRTLSPEIAEALNALAAFVYEIEGGNRWPVDWSADRHVQSAIDKAKNIIKVPVWERNGPGWKRAALARIEGLEARP